MNSCSNLVHSLIKKIFGLFLQAVGREPIFNFVDRLAHPSARPANVFFDLLGIHAVLALRPIMLSRLGSRRIFRRRKRSFFVPLLPPPLLSARRI